MIDEDTVLEFERICNQAQSLEHEQRDLGDRARRKRTLLARIGFGAAILAALILLAVVLLVAATTLIVSALLATLVSIGSSVASRLGANEEEVAHYVCANELAVLLESCRFVLAEHVGGNLPAPELRIQLEHHTRHFSRLSHSLEHPFR